MDADKFESDIAALSTTIAKAIRQMVTGIVVQGEAARDGSAGFSQLQLPQMDAPPAPSSGKPASQSRVGQPVPLDLDGLMLDNERHAQHSQLSKHDPTVSQLYDTMIQQRQADTDYRDAQHRLATRMIYDANSDLRRIEWLEAAYDRSRETITDVNI